MAVSAARGAGIQTFPKSATVNAKLERRKKPAFVKWGIWRIRSPLMATNVSKLTLDDMVALAAYAASLQP